MKKTLPALLTAFIITAFMGIGILLIGGNALFNSNGVAISSSATASASSADQAAQIKLLQSQLAEYQTREQQYKTQLDKAAQQIRTDASQIQQFQMLLSALQNRGLITISSDGRIFLNQ